MKSLSEVATGIATGFTKAGCTGTLHAVALSSGLEIFVDSDTQVLMASTFKPIVALEFYAQVQSGELDPTSTIELAPGRATPGPTGISNFRDPVRMSLRDLAYLALTISDNAATDALIGAASLNRINARAKACGCHATIIESDLAAMLDTMAAELGFSSYATLVEAQSGKFGDQARLRSTDPKLVDAVTALDPQRGSRTTARDMTKFLTAVWADTAADPEACQNLREVMAQQVTRRFEVATPDGGHLAAKSGGLFRRIRNEIGIITDPQGERYAVAVFTRAHQPLVGTAAINIEIGHAADTAIRALQELGSM